MTVQVLTQCRDHIIRRTFDALKGAPSAVVHFYNSTSVAQREQVFKKSKEEIRKIATDGAALVKQLAAEYELEVCNAVLDILEPTAEKPVIINLPVTVAMSMSHVYANQIEYMSDNLKYREHVILSLHPHNDRGCGGADTELSLLAGADRAEGTLVGTCTHLIFKGVHYEMEVTTPDGFEWLVHSTDMCPVGKQVGIKVDPFDIQIMNKPASEDEEAVGVNE